MYMQSCTVDAHAVMYSTYTCHVQYMHMQSCTVHDVIRDVERKKERKKERQTPEAMEK